MLKSGEMMKQDDKTIGTILFIAVIIIVIILAGIIAVQQQDISFKNARINYLEKYYEFIDGEYREGFIFDVIEYVNTYNNGTTWIDNRTTIIFKNIGWKYFEGSVPFINQLDNSSIYGIFYDSVLCDYLSKPGKFYELRIIKITDNVGNILWEL